MPSMPALLLLAHVLDTRVSVVLETPGRGGQIVRLAPGARVEDALRRQRVRVPVGWVVLPPLATVLRDGMAIRVSRLPRTERLGGRAPGGGKFRASIVPSSAPAWPLDLNRADARALDTLPGIGPGLAKAILARRAARGGRLRGPADLEGLRGLGPRRIARIRPLVAFR